MALKLTKKQKAKRNKLRNSGQYKKLNRFLNDLRAKQGIKKVPFAKTKWAKEEQQQDTPKNEAKKTPQAQTDGQSVIPTQDRRPPSTNMNAGPLPGLFTPQVIAPADAQRNAFKGIKGRTEEGRDLVNDLSVADRLLKQGDFLQPSPMIDNRTPVEQQNAINQLVAMTDPNSPAYAGNSSPEVLQAFDALRQQQQSANVVDPRVAAALDQQQSLMQQANVRSADDSDTIARMSGVADEAGVRSQELTDALSNLQQRASSAGARTAEMQDVFDRMQKGLSGYSAEENTALRERALEGIRREQAENQRNLQRSNALRTGGVSALAQMRNNFEANRNVANVERDLLIDNIARKDSRLQNYGSLLREVERDEYNRGSDASKSYLDRLAGVESDEQGRRLAAENALASTRRNIVDSERTNRLNTANSYFDSSQRNAQNMFDNVANANTRVFDAATGMQENNSQRQARNVDQMMNLVNNRENRRNAIDEFNIGNLQKDRSARFGSYFNLANLLNTSRNNTAINNIAMAEANRPAASSYTNTTYQMANNPYDSEEIALR